MRTGGKHNKDRYQALRSAEELVVTHLIYEVKRFVFLVKRCTMEFCVIHLTFLY